MESSAGLNNFTGDSYAFYIQDTVEFIPFWKATLGVRRDNLDAEYTSATSPELNFGEWSYRAALSYQPTETAHYYFGYSDSFSPTADLYQLTVAPQPPETSEVMKSARNGCSSKAIQLPHRALQRNKYWERSTDLESTAAILTKKRRTNGIELEAAGRITPNWEVFSGLALMDAEILDTAENVNATTGVITKGNLDYIGQRPRNTPSTRSTCGRPTRSAAAGKSAAASRSRAIATATTRAAQARFPPCRPAPSSIPTPRRRMTAGMPWSLTSRRAGPHA